MKTLGAALCSLFFCASLFAQGGSVSGEAIKSTAGQAGTVTVCTDAAATLPNCGCTVHASVYSDSALSIPKDNPLATDAQGNYSYFAATGEYKEQVSAGGSCYTRRVTVFATKKYVDDSDTSTLAASKQYTDDAISSGSSSGVVGCTSGSIKDAIDALPAAGGEVKLCPNTTYSISCGVNQVNTGTKVVKIMGAGETSVIEGTGCALVTLASSGSTIESLTVKQTVADDNTIGVLVGTNTTTEVTRWAIRDVYLYSQDKFKGSAIKTIFGLEGLVHGGEVRGWNCGVELTGYDAGHRSNANSFVAAKIRWGKTGFCIPADAIDNVFIDSSVIEGNSVNAISAASGHIHADKSHFEQNGDATHPQVELLGDALIVSKGNFYGFFPPTPNMDIRVAVGNTSPHDSKADVFDGGITHNGSGLFIVQEPVIDFTTTGTGTVITQKGQQITASNDTWGFVLAGFAQFDVRMPIVNSEGDTKITSIDGQKTFISNVTQDKKVAEFDPATQTTYLFGPIVVSGASTMGKGLCIGANKKIGYCSTVLDAAGNCTCNEY